VIPQCIAMAKCMARVNTDLRSNNNKNNNSSISVKTRILSLFARAFVGHRHSKVI
jgi:hypothetical protein